jgi:hypothetical protein
MDYSTVNLLLFGCKLLIVFKQVYKKMTRVLEAGDLSADSLDVDASRHVRGSVRRSDQLLLSLDDVKVCFQGSSQDLNLNVPKSMSLQR